MTENNTASEATSTEIDVVEEAFSAGEVENLINNFASAEGALYTTVQGDDFETNIAVAGAIAGAGKIDDVEGDKIMLKDFIIQGIELADEETGEMVHTTRVILIDEHGDAYAGISKALVKGLQLLTRIAGHPNTWPSPVAVAVDRETTRKGYKVFNIVPWAASKNGKKERAAGKK